MNYLLLITWFKVWFKINNTSIVLLRQSKNTKGISLIWILFVLSFIQTGIESGLNIFLNGLLCIFLRKPFYLYDIVFMMRFVRSKWRRHPHSGKFLEIDVGARCSLRVLILRIKMAAYLNTKKTFLSFRLPARTIDAAAGTDLTPR